MRPSGPRRHVPARRQPIRSRGEPAPEVYRSRDARQATYRDVNPMSDGGFHFVVIGIRNPDYSH